MTTYISLLRGINVSGKNKIKMVDLKKCYESLGLRDVRTYIQSGNVLFTSDHKKQTEVATLIERGIEETFDLAVSVLTRSKKEWTSMVEERPFSIEDPAKMHVTFLAEPANRYIEEPIRNKKSESEDFSISQKEVYLLCPDGYGKTKLTNTFIEKSAGVKATTRNWKTVMKLAEMMTDL
ncbi:DUF1697 domain-containing protein [Bacillus sp. 2205SS5-2]|uniref:DUF1697 domain-containing protein n=1 Tax=Bacillus sp. 2205SS5-2 TaxID=3109031 RepID=UPI0030070E95